MELDHVLIAVDDLEVAAAEFDSRYGLASVGGGRHPGWGTANRIVPLGDTYIELVAVVDEAEALGSPFGRWVAGGRPGRPLGWAVRTRQLDVIARRLELTVHPGSRSTADGGLLRWRTAGMEAAAAEPSLPFFIEWAPDGPFPGRAPVRHREGATTIIQLIVSGDLDGLSLWLGTHRLPIIVRAGIPAVAGIVVSTDSGPLVLGLDKS